MGWLIIDRGPCSGPSSSNRTDRQIRKRPLDAAGRTVDSRLQNQILRSTIGRDVEVDGHWSSLCVSPFGGSGRQLSSRSEEHTSELQSLMRISYAVFCLKKKKQN